MRVWQVEHTLNIVLYHSISNKICFNVSNAPLKMIRKILSRFKRGTGVYGSNYSNSRYLKRCTALPGYKSRNIFCFSDEEVHCHVK